MTDYLEELHAQQGLAALIANPNLLAVYDGKVPDSAPFPYVLVYTRVQWPRDGLGTSLSALQVTATATFTCHCAAESAAAARAVQGQVRSALLNFRPAITGRNCSPIKQDESLDPNRDETTGRLVMDAVSIYSYMSTG